MTSGSLRSSRTLPHVCVLRFVGSGIGHNVFVQVTLQTRVRRVFLYVYKSVVVVVLVLWYKRNKTLLLLKENNQFQE